MSLIKKISLEHTIDYSDNLLEYFYCVASETNLINYQQITDKIRVAEKSIRIATTSEIADEIFDAMHQNNHVNSYILFKSFQNASKSLSKFDSKNPAVSREVKSLDNNFIIIDDVSYLMVNSLSEKENIFLLLDENETQDLSFIFNYLFWNCATLEKLVDKISQPVESPFPPFENRELDNINLTDEALTDVETLFIPKDKSFNDELIDEIAHQYFSDDIQTSIYIAEDQSQIGQLRIKNRVFKINNKWALKTEKLADIPTAIDIIPRTESWNKTITIASTKDVKLKDLAASTIEQMQQTEPVDFPLQKYTQKASFSWDVLPPIKPNNANQSALYRDYQKLAEDFNQQLSRLEKILNDLKQQSGLLQTFLGFNRTVVKNIQRLAKYQQIKLEQYKPNDLTELLTVEFADFFNEVIDSQKSFKKDRQKQQAQEKWEQTKKDKSTELEKKLKQLKTIKSDLETQTDKNKVKKLKNTEKNLQKNIENLQQDIANNYENFKYEPKTNELANLLKDKQIKYKTPNIPKFALPELGTLYDTKDCYYLAISDYEQLVKANELAKRYNDKKYKVVVGDNNE